MRRIKAFIIKNKLPLLITLPIITFCIGLLLPSPLRKILKKEKIDEFSEAVYIDTVYADGSRYTGGFFDGKRSGEGSYIVKKDTFEGEWRNNLLKYGIRRTPSSIYQGYFNDELMNDGFGVVTYSDFYIQNKLMNGVDTKDITIYYAGNWKENTKEGLGRSHKLDGSMEFGMYKNALLQVPPGQQFRHGDLVYGIDASHYQENIDWDHLAIYCDQYGKAYDKNPPEKTYMQPVLFAFLKVSEGATIQDNRYSVRMKEAKRHGIARGSYHFFHIDTPVQSQIDNFLDAVQWNIGDLPPALDFETDPDIITCTDEEVRQRVLQWLTNVEQQLGVRPIIYTRENIRNRFFNDPQFNRYDFWIARYEKKPDCDGWIFWQHTEKAKIEGNIGNIDINIYKGNYTSFMNYLFP